MSKKRTAKLIVDMIFIILAAIFVIVNVCTGDYGEAILWNMSFTLWLCDIALDLALREKEKITTKLKEKDDE